MSETEALFSLTSLVHYVTERVSRILDRLFLNDWCDIGDSKLFTTISLIMYHTFFPYEKKLKVFVNDHLVCKEITLAYEFLKENHAITINKLNHKLIRNTSINSTSRINEFPILILPTSLKQRIDFAQITDQFLFDLGTNFNFPFLSQYNSLELFGIIAWQHSELLYDYRFQETVYFPSEKFKNTVRIRVKNILQAINIFSCNLNTKAKIIEILEEIQVTYYQSLQQASLQEN